MDLAAQIRDFLTSRRARLAPADVGLPDAGGRRQVAGLRREEVATLAGVSVDWYVRMERGSLTGVSDSVLEAVSRALRLDETERAHLHDLARAANRSPGVRRPAPPARVRPEVQRLLDSMAVPAWVRNGRSDFLAGNQLGWALYAPVFTGSSTTPNTARSAFLDPAARVFWRDWDRVATDAVAVLRAEAGRHPYDRGLTDLIGELATHSEEFRVRWAAHDVKVHRGGVKQLHHPVVGDLDLSYEVLALVADDGLMLITYDAAAGSASADGLRLLASWAATEPMTPGAVRDDLP